MLGNYSHLISADANKALLQSNGIIEKEDVNRVDLKPKICPRKGCEELNAFDAKYCKKCFGFLDLSTALEIDDKFKLYERFIDVLTKEINSEVSKDDIFKNMIFERIFSKPNVEEMLNKFKEKANQHE